MKNRSKVLFAFLKEHDDYLLTGHVRPDGDSCASIVALALLLRSMGKKAFIYDTETFPPEYRFLLKGVDSGTRPLNPVLVAVDCGDIQRISYKGDYSALVNIDHHASNCGYGTISLLRSDASSACEVIFDFFKTTGLKPDVRFYEALYTGIMTDTGNFSFANVSPATMRAVAEIISHTGEPSRLNAAVYSSKEPGKVRLTGAVMERIRLYCSGKLAVSHISLKDMEEYGVSENQFDGIIDTLRDIKGVEIYILMKEKSEGEVRLSLRSKGTIAVDGFAGTLESGGGHGFAAGATARGTLDDVEKLIKQYWERIL